MKGDFDFSEFTAFVENFEKVVEEDGDISYFKEAVEGVGRSVVDSAKPNTPTRVKNGGKLRGSWETEDARVHAGVNITVDVVNNANYASFVEEGHYTRGGKGRVPGVHMLKNAMEKIGTTEFPKRVTQNFDKLLRKASGD